jgi:hypothetical protein
MYVMMLVSLQIVQSSSFAVAVVMWALSFSQRIRTEG